MPELRRDPISGGLVIVAVERAARPYTVAPAPTDLGVPADCPFCAGHEAQTPPEVQRTGSGEPDTPGWRVRVVPNLYPIVERGHEVVILSPDHRATFGRLVDDVAVEVLTVVRDRVRHHLDAGRGYVSVFVNQGRAAGASIAHPHAQLVALDLVPPAVEELLARFETDLVAREIADARRDDLVVADGPAPAWSPHACGTPYGLRVAHRSTRARFDQATDAEIAVVALGLRDALAALERLLGDVAYNVVVHTAPPDRRAGEFHWHLEVLPRTGVVAGFEHGTGILVNVVPPEQAARLLRDGP